MTVFRSLPPSTAHKSDKSARDRQRHRDKIRESIRKNIVDIISEEAIIGKSNDKVIKVPMRGIKEYKFIYGDNTPGVAQGKPNSKVGDVIGRVPEGASGSGIAGNEAGQDFFETEITIDELVDILFEDLELPYLERKILKEVSSERISKHKGYQSVGIRVRLDKKQTVKAKIKRKLASHVEDGEDFPFHKEDLTYKRLKPDTKPESNAVVFCVMDVSGSMSIDKKYLARSFFFLLHRFVCTKYENVEVVFIAHDSSAKEVTEEDFFHRAESGGTMISSAYNKVLEVIEARYHPSLWNIYCFHCSDGDNFSHDNDDAVGSAFDIAKIVNLFGYCEIKPDDSFSFGSSMLSEFSKIKEEHFVCVQIKRKDDIFPGFKKLLANERVSNAK